ncbi:MAG TPA: hypothetical protein DIC42_03985, partial [Holosporales bacterium]|nr:hypothetical protein [Holosporales bacterium]
MRFWFSLIFLLSMQAPTLCDFKPYVLEKKIKLDDKLLIKVEKNTLLFDWLKHTKTALIHVETDNNEQEWWFVFDDIPKAIVFPEDHDLPVGVLSLRQETNTSVEKTHLIIKIKISNQFIFKVSNNKTTWSVHVLQQNNTQKDSIVQLNTKIWPNTTYPSVQDSDPYILNIIQTNKNRSLICFLMDKSTGFVSSFETPFYKVFNSVHGGGADLFSDDVKLIKHKGSLTLKVMTPLKNQHDIQISEKKSLPAQIGIFKNYSSNALLAYLNTTQDIQIQHKNQLADMLHRAWIEIMVGNERAALSFISDIEKEYPGVAHHPFVRVLKTIAYIMDTNFTKAQENALYLPQTAENKLLTALIEAGKGVTIAQKSNLSMIGDIYKQYTQNIRDEIMGPVLITLIDRKDYETLETLINNMPEPTTLQFRGYFQYARIMLTLSKDTAENETKKLDDFITDIQFGKLSPRLQAHALYQKLLIDMRHMRISTKDAVKQLVSLSYMWRGEQLEAQTLLTLSTLLMENKQYKQALHYFQRIRDSYIAMYELLHLHKKMQTCFVNFFKDNIERVSPLRVIHFYETYKEYTPNSFDEVNIIKIVATNLMKLDLLEQSAALLTAGTKNNNSRNALIDFYIEAAQMHINNKSGEFALLTLNVMPKSGVEKYADVIVLLKSRAYASMGQLDKALQLLDKENTIN